MPFEFGVLEILGVQTLLSGLGIFRFLAAHMSYLMRPLIGSPDAQISMDAVFSNVTCIFKKLGRVLSSSIAFAITSCILKAHSCSKG